MSRILAVCGKGGTGKTSISALVVRYLTQSGLVPVLAVDADPNANLWSALGCAEPRTLGQVREEFVGTNITMPAGMSRQQLFELRLNEILVERRGFDLLVMGRPEGPGCYCFVNNLLKEQIERLASAYRYVVVDNEAGLEHLSRRTTERVDTLLLVSDSSVKGARSIHSIKMLAGEMGIVPRRSVILVNRVPSSGLPVQVREELRRLDLEADLLLPEDQAIITYDLEQKSLIDLPGDCTAARALDGFLSRFLLA